MDNKGKSKMMLLSESLSKNFGRGLLTLMLINNLIQLLIGYYLPALVVVNLVAILICLYIVSTRVQHLVAREHIAESVLRLTELIHSVHSKEELYQKILEEVVASVSGGEKGSLMSLGHDSNLIFEAVVGFDKEAIQKIELKLEDTFLYRSTNGHITKSMVAENISEYNRANLHTDVHNAMIKAGVDQVRTTISFPILINGKLFGMLNVDSTSPAGVRNEDVQMVDYFTVEISKIIHLYEVFENTIRSAKYDHLTNASSRSNFMNILDNIMENEKHRPTEFVILYCDLDGLKPVNDIYGHDVGDQYLIHFVKGMRRYLKGEEIIARFGGDEFVILLLRDQVEVQDYIDLCKHWMQTVRLKGDGYDLEVKYSCGMASYPNDGLNIDELISIADEAMYQEKHN